MNRPSFVSRIREVLNFVGGEGRVSFFYQSTSQDVRGRKNPLIPAYLTESAQAFPPESVGSRNRIQSLEDRRSVNF